MTRQVSVHEMWTTATFLWPMPPADILHVPVAQFNNEVVVTVPLVIVPNTTQKGKGVAAVHVYPM